MTSITLILKLIFASIAAGVVCIAGTHTSSAHEPPPARADSPRRISHEQRTDFQSRFTAAYTKKDYPAAERILLDWLNADPDNFVVYYNLACTLGQLGKLEDTDTDKGAGHMLKLAVVHGFSNKRILLTDPDLEPLRSTPDYQKILDVWDEIVARRVEANLSAAKAQFGPTYTYERDNDRRLILISGFDATLFSEAQDEITRLIDWWHTLVVEEGNPVTHDDDSWAMVILPTRQDYAVWALNRFGLSWQRIGGSYSHDDKTLVAQDLGSSMRHEFWHLLHWRDMERRGQIGAHAQPTWVQEGLCSLVEDVRVTDNRGTKKIEFLPSWRTNISRRLAKMNKLTPWSRLFAMDQREFVGNRPLSAYAQSRTVFMYLHAHSKLRDWYAAYTKNFSDDPTGKLAFEKVFDKPLADVEREFQAWVLTLPEVAEELKPGMATLPFDIDPGHGDGVILTSSAKTKAGRQSGLRLNDVITAIDDIPIRDMNDYIRVMADHQPGDEVSVEYRRAKLHKTTTIELDEVDE